ncbi:MAG: hypothetical protein ACOY46_13960 [Bacillota bacterium]
MRKIIAHDVTIYDDAGMQYLGETSPNVFTFRLTPTATDVKWVKIFVSDCCRINIHVTAIDIIIAPKEVVLHFYSNTDPQNNPDLHSLAKVKEISVGRELNSILVVSLYYWDD